MMGSSDLLAAFNAAGASKVSASAARLRYDHLPGPNMQVIEFDGMAGGEPFALISDPFPAGMNPIDKAREMAMKLAEAQAANMSNSLEHSPKDSGV